jgi:hypothetical protein
MNVESLTNTDVKANELVTMWASGTSSEKVGIETCAKKMGVRLNEVYGASPLPLDLLSSYGLEAGEWVLNQAEGMAFSYIVLTVGKALIRVYHDHANGKVPPEPEAFRKYILHAEGGVYTITGAKATLTVTHKDGSVDSR